MNLYALNFTGNRDFFMSYTLEEQLRKHSTIPVVMFRRIWCDGTEWGNGAGWEASMKKVRHLRSIEIPPDDYLMCVDSDVLFFANPLFKWLEGSPGEFMGVQNYVGIQTHHGVLRHMGGCIQFIKGNILSKINQITDNDLLQIREEFRAIVLCENEDIVVSYLAMMMGAKFVEIPGELRKGDFFGDLERGSLESFYHFNMIMSEFLGMPVKGKWEIANVLKQKKLI